MNGYSFGLVFGYTQFWESSMLRLSQKSTSLFAAANFFHARNHRRRK
jgi:hypothetical protein